MAVSWEVGYQYAVDVDNGTTPACKWVRLACRRFLDDMEHGHERGLVFDVDKAQDVLDFFDHVSHIKGRWAGQPIEPSDWQVFVIINLYGWLWEATGLRRFKKRLYRSSQEKRQKHLCRPAGPVHDPLG